MATINEALKKLFLGLGGDAKDLSDNSTVVDNILAVVNGAWAKVTISATANTETGAVTITLTPDQT